MYKNYAPLPDLGWYKPERIHNGALGFGATEMREDVILRLQRKSEFAAVLFKARVRDVLMPDDSETLWM